MTISSSQSCRPQVSPVLLPESGPQHNSNPEDPPDSALRPCRFTLLPWCRGLLCQPRLRSPRRNQRLLDRLLSLPIHLNRRHPGPAAAVRPLSDFSSTVVLTGLCVLVSGEFCRAQAGRIDTIRTHSSRNPRITLPWRWYRKPPMTSRTPRPMKAATRYACPRLKAS